MYEYKIGDIVRLKSDADFDHADFGRSLEGVIDDIVFNETYPYIIESTWTNESRGFSLDEIDCLVNPPKMVLRRI